MKFDFDLHRFSVGALMRSGSLSDHLNVPKVSYITSLCISSITGPQQVAHEVILQLGRNFAKNPNHSALSKYKTNLLFYKFLEQREDLSLSLSTYRVKWNPKPWVRWMISYYGLV